MKTIEIYDNDFEIINYFRHHEPGYETIAETIESMLEEYLHHVEPIDFHRWHELENKAVWNTDDYGTIRTYSTGGGCDLTECRIKYLGMDMVLVLDNENSYTLYYNRRDENSDDPFTDYMFFESFDMCDRLPDGFMDTCRKMMAQRHGDGLEEYKKHCEVSAPIDEIEYYKSIFGDDFHRVITAENVNKSKLSPEAKFYIDRYGWDYINDYELETEEEINKFASAGYFVTCDEYGNVAYIAHDLEVANAICKLQNAKGGHFTVEFDDDPWCSGYEIDDDAPYTLVPDYSGKYTIGSQFDNSKAVKIREFIDLYNKELEIKFNDDPTVSETAHIYGYDIKIYWNGYVVSVGDGAIPTNHLIPALEAMDEEWEGEL